jgi:hypothetical protein
MGVSLRWADYPPTRAVRTRARPHRSRTSVSGMVDVDEVRSIAQVFIDLMSVITAATEDEEQVDAQIAVAATRFMDLGAVSASMSPDSETAQVDLTMLVSGAVYAMQALLDVTEQLSPDKYVEELLVDWREQVGSLG